MSLALGLLRPAPARSDFAWARSRVGASDSGRAPANAGGTRPAAGVASLPNSLAMPTLSIEARSALTKAGFEVIFETDGSWLRLRKYEVSGTPDTCTVDGKPSESAPDRSSAISSPADLVIVSFWFCTSTFCRTTRL